MTESATITYADVRQLDGTYDENDTLVQAADRLLQIIAADRHERLDKVDHYLHGRHARPYLPRNASDEYRLLADRSVSNMMPLLVSTPAQSLYVDGWRRGKGKAPLSIDSPEWKRWQKSNMDSRQLAVHSAALGYGHSFVVVDRAGQMRGLSPLRTAALFEDPANDQDPVYALTIKAHPTTGKDAKRGVATMWDRTNEYTVKFGAGQDVAVGAGVRHGSTRNPVTRFTAAVDLDGRTVGVVEPMIPLQDRINQTVFDLLVAQTYGSFKVRWVTGMAPPVKLHGATMRNPDYDPNAPGGSPNAAFEIEDPDFGEPVIDERTGQPVPLEIDTNAARMLFAEDADTHFGTLDHTPLDGYISAIDAAVKLLSAISQTPPHYLLGQIANLSAEALTAAETSLARKVEEFRKGFGESWERVFSIAAEMDGDAAEDDYTGEIVWRDMEQRSLAQAADALGKLSQQLEIPSKGLWRRVPGVTQPEIDEWTSLYEEKNAQVALANSVRNRQQLQQPQDGQPADPQQQQGAQAPQQMPQQMQQRSPAAGPSA